MWRKKNLSMFLYIFSYMIEPDVEIWWLLLFIVFKFQQSKSPKITLFFHFQFFIFLFGKSSPAKKKRLTHNEELEGFISLVVEKVLASTNRFVVDPNARSDLSLPWISQSPKFKWTHSVGLLLIIISSIQVFQWMCINIKIQLPFDYKAAHIVADKSLMVCAIIFCIKYFQFICS